MEFRKVLYLLLQFIIKAITQEQPNGRDAQSKVRGGGVELPRPLRAPSTLCSPTQKLIKSHHLRLYRASSPAPLPILEIGVWRWKLQASDHLVFPVTSPSLRLSRGPI